MALFDFLFGGGDSAPPVQSSGITTTDIPSYVAEPAAQLIGAAADVASEDFVPYSGPRLAGLSHLYPYRTPAKRDKFEDASAGAIT